LQRTAGFGRRAGLGADGCISRISRSSALAIGEVTDLPPISRISRSSASAVFMARDLMATAIFMAPAVFRVGGGVDGEGGGMEGGVGVEQGNRSARVSPARK
jgi:hypothetical protein